MLTSTAASLAAIVLIGAGGGLYAWGRHDGRQLELAERATQDEIARVAADAAATAAAGAIAKIEVKHVTVRQQIEREILEKPVYRGCFADERVFELTNEAITGNPAARSGELPAAGADDGGDLRGVRPQSF